MDELVLTVILAAVVAAAAFSGLSGVQMGAPFCLALVAMSAAMHFAFSSLKKAGMGEGGASAALAAIVLAGYFVSLLSFGLLGSALKLSLIPLSLCIPAISFAAKGISV